MQSSLPYDAGTRAQRGYFGKIPSRGDFVRAGLPRGFVAPWDAWLQDMLTASRAALGEDWMPAWMEAPIWCFLLQPGACGPEAALGMFMPSVDRAGRLFPLSLAWVAPSAATFATEGMAWLEQAEAAGLAALEQDLEPDALIAALQAETNTSEAIPGDPASQAPLGACAWWTSGSPRVPAAAFATRALPDAALFTRMLDARMPNTCNDAEGHADDTIPKELGS
jgi:type VI secretion system protein ImpM